MCFEVKESGKASTTMSDFDAVRKKRLEELEQKKKRLEEMRKNKKEREDDAAQLSLSSSSIGRDAANKHEDVDDLVKSLLGNDGGAKGSASSASNTAADLGKVWDDGGLCVACRRPENLVQKSPLISPPSPTKVNTPPPPAPAQLRPERYDKDTQTEADDLLYLGVPPPSDDEFLCLACQRLSPSSPLRNRRRTGSQSRDAGDNDGFGGPFSLSADSADHATRPRSSSSSSNNGNSNSNRIGGNEVQGVAPTRRQLSEQESAQIFASPAFLNFVARSSAVVEKFLIVGASASNPLPVVDPLKDYQSEGRSRRGNEGSSLSPIACLTDDSLLGRAVTSISFSPHHPELFCVSYGSKISGVGGSGGDDGGAAPGLVLIYSTGFLGRPEFRLCALAPVLAASFHPQDPHIVVGGCYSGQVVLWDLRACKPGGQGPAEHPTHRSNMSGRGHKHPISSMCFALPGAGASSSVLELLTVSSDGQICHWDLSSATSSSSTVTVSSRGGGGAALLLAEPLVVSTLQVPVSADGSSLALDPGASMSPCPTITAMTFGQHPGSTDSAREGVVGSGTGQLFRFPVPYSPSSTVRGVEAHSGLVTAMHLHPSSSRACRNLLLTASMDWTTKLWNVAANSSPLLEFRTSAYDYVCDVAWSPANVAVFATVCTCGTIFVWNLSRSTSEPWDSLRVPGNNSALNKLSWSRDGHLLLVGDCGGRVHVVTLSGSVLPESGDEGRFELAVSRSGVEQQREGFDNMM